MRNLFLILFITICKFSFGQPSSYVINLGPTQLSSYGHGVHQSASGSIYLSGYGDDATTLYSLISFTKLDEYGNEIFTKYFGDSIHHFMLMRMLTIDDNNFLLVGSRMVHGGNNNPYAVKLDSTGSVIWETLNSSSQNSWYTGVSRFQNGNLVFTGATSDTINGDLNLSGVITDSLGTIIHSFSFGDIGVSETSENCVVSDDGTILICGDRPINISVVNPYVAAFDSTGNYLWDLTISTHNNSGSKNVYLDRNNDLLVIGESATDSSPQFDIQLTKINIASGSQIWTKLIQGTNQSDAGFALSETLDGNYALAGYGYDSILSSKRIVLIITDTSGNELSKKYFGSSPINIGYDICPSIFGGFLIAGADFVNNQEVLVYQKELGIGISELYFQDAGIYPNPISGNAELHFKNPADKFSITDITGKLIVSNILSTTTKSYSLPLLQCGTYFIRYEFTGKLFQSILLVTE